MKKNATIKASLLILSLLCFILVRHSSHAQGTVTFEPVNKVVSFIGNDTKVQIKDNYRNNSENAAKLELLERASGTYSGGAYFLWNGKSNNLFIGTKNNNVDSPIITVSRYGQSVGIGTTTHQNGFKLSVNGRIKSRGVLCSVGGWADFVFKEDYNLRSLIDVKKFIDDNGHLPDMPSEKEVMKDGIELQVMDQKLLQKIEELTLYLIAQQQEIDALTHQLENLKQ